MLLLLVLFLETMRGSKFVVFTKRKLHTSFRLALKPVILNVMKRSEHITDALISLHWLRVPERIIFKVATLTFRALHGTAPPYMTSQFTRVADNDMPNRRRLRSASSNQLDVPSFRLPTVGSRAFPIAGAKI